jgi:predicted DNA-binding transcriptional regulator AlpA
VSVRDTQKIGSVGFCRVLSCDFGALESIEGHPHRHEDPLKYEPLSDQPLTAREAAAAVGLSLAAFWRAVAADRLPSPVYPMPRAPRWFGAELRSALSATRRKPHEAKAERRAVQLARTAVAGERENRR